MSETSDTIIIKVKFPDNSIKDIELDEYGPEKKQSKEFKEQYYEDVLLLIYNDKIYISDSIKIIPGISSMLKIFSNAQDDGYHVYNSTHDRFELFYKTDENTRAMISLNHTLDEDDDIGAYIRLMELFGKKEYEVQDTNIIKVRFHKFSPKQDVQIAIYERLRPEKIEGKEPFIYDYIIFYNDKLYRHKHVTCIYHKTDDSKKNVYDCMQKFINNYDVYCFYHFDTDSFWLYCDEYDYYKGKGYALRYDPDENDEIRKYIREHGLFETNEYVLK